MSGAAGQKDFQPVFLKIICPPSPLHEQTAIAAYLDEKTANIDTLIRNKQKLVSCSKRRKPP